ncbi:hypothetical protein ATCC90586_007415 [Pythium insidiosum]|nr:hypothetical protein ATCC90586_007415 [Pythium insidiosum]
MELLGKGPRPRARARERCRAPLLALVATTALVTLWTCWRVAEAPSPGATLWLSTYPSVIQDGGDLVVYWHGTARRHEKDFVALSCGPQRDANDVLAARNVTSTDATPNSVRFSGLYMMRCDYRVVYFAYRVATRTFAPLASLVVGMRDSFDRPKQGHLLVVGMRDSFDRPKQGHLSLTTDGDAMVISFNSASSRTPLARYGRQRDALARVVAGKSTTYAASDMCEAPATTMGQRLYRDPGYMHTVVMPDLEPDADYFYQFGNDVDGWSDVSQFRSPPRVVPNATVKFIAYGDMGVDAAPAGQSTAVRAYRDVTSNGFTSFLLHVGDLRGDGSVWDKFMHTIEPLATRIPYMVSIGNPPATGNSLFWYSFDYGSVHVIQLSSEHDWTRGSTQLRWLEQDLAAVNRTVTPWVVVTVHRMMYSTKNGLDDDHRVGMHLREELEQLLMDHRVNLVLVAGHQHSYERTCAVYRGQCVPDGRSAPVHMIVGSAGFDLSHSGYSPRFGNWSIAHIDDYGYVRAVIERETMTLQFVSNRRGVVADEVTLHPFLQ